MSRSAGGGGFGWVTKPSGSEGKDEQAEQDQRDQKRPEALPQPTKVHDERGIWATTTAHTIWIGRAQLPPPVRPAPQGRVHDLT